MFQRRRYLHLSKMFTVGVSIDPERTRGRTVTQQNHKVEGKKKKKKKAQLVSAALINGEISQMDSGGSEASPPHRLRQCFPVAPVSCWSCICPAAVMVHGSEYSHRNTKQF